MSVWIRLAVLNLAWFVVFRLAFLLSFRSQAGELGAGEILQAFYLGTKFDLRFTFIILLPLILLCKIPGLNFIKSARAQKVWLGIYTALAVVWMHTYFIDFGYYAYLDARLNSTALHFLKNPLISFQMMWETYNLPLLTLLFFALVTGYYWLLRKFVFRAVLLTTPPLPIPKKKKIVRNLAFTCIFAFGLYGKFAYYPLRWSEAFAHSNTFAAALGLNPVLYFFDTLKFKDVQIDMNKVKNLYPEFAKYLGVENTENLNFARVVEPQKNWKKKPNIILIVMESLATHRTNMMGSPVNPTPNLAKLANESYYFSEHFAASEGTARSVFSMTTGVPDVSTVKTASRNPFFVDQRIVLNSFDGYKKLYMIGGSANWANIRAVFANNITDLEIMEEGQYTEPRTDVWGLSDYHLFKEALRKVEKIPQPFFTFVQAASFHRPYTIPEGSDFKKTEVPLDDLTRAGFESLAEYNSLRFTDYALGYFIEEFKKSPLYENTIIIVTGDHGLPENAADFFPQQRRFYQMEKFHVPLIFHNKKLFPEGVVDSKPAGEVDIITSAASLAGIEHTNYTLGRDLFNSKFDDERYAFTYTYYTPTRPYSLIGKDFVLMASVKGKTGLYKKDSETPTEDVQKAYPDVFKRMKAIADGYLHSAEYLLRNNKKPQP